MEIKAEPITKVVNFRLTFDVYKQYLKESEKKKITLTDCILEKLNDSTKVKPLEKRIQELQKQNKELISNFLNVYGKFTVYAVKNGDVNNQELAEIISSLKGLL